MASNGRNCVATSEGMTKEQVMSLSFRERLMDPPDVIRALRCQWRRNGGGGGLRGLEPPLISGGAPLFLATKIFFNLYQKVFCAWKLSSVSLKKLEPSHRETSSYANGCGKEEWLTST